MLTVKQAKDFKAFNGTCLQGHVYADYKVLKKVFGKPSEGDGYKVDAEWDVVFSDGTIATIYNYKDGKNYNGSRGLAKTQITDWHVGGRSARAVANVEAVLEQYYAKQETLTA
jgi:hypothetical protein